MLYITIKDKVVDDHTIIEGTLIYEGQRWISVVELLPDSSTEHRNVLIESMLKRMLQKLK